MKTNVEILGLRLKQREPNAAGTVMVASFDAVIGVIEMRECGLMRKRDGDLFALPPRGQTADKTRGLIRITDPDAYYEMQARATAAYRALTGTDDIVAAG